MARLVLGTNINNTGTSSTVVEKQVPMPYSKIYINDNGKLKPSQNIMDLTGITDVDSYCMAYAYINSPITFDNVDLSFLQQVSGSYAFQSAYSNCQNVHSVDLSSLETVSGESAFSNAFSNCQKLVSVDFSSLISVTGTSAFGGAFYRCYALTNIEFPALTSITGTNAFYTAFSQCTKLENASFPALTTLNSRGGEGAFYGMFSGCNKLKTVKFNKLNIINESISQSYGGTFACSMLESIEFGGLTASTFETRKNQFRYLFHSTTGQNAPNGCTLHLPSNFDPDNPAKTFDITTLTGYPTFNGNANYIHIAYDLPATE